MDRISKKLIKDKIKNGDKIFCPGQAPLNPFRDHTKHDMELSKQQAARRRKNDNVNLALMKYKECNKCNKVDGLLYVQTTKTDWIVCKHCGCKVKVKDVLKSIVHVRERK